MRWSTRVGAAILMLLSVLVAVAASGGESEAWGPTAYSGTLKPTHNTSLCLDAPNPSGVWPSTGYPVSGTPLSVWSCHGNPNQDWTAERITNELYRIRSSWSNQCLEIAPSGGNDSLTSGLALTVRTCVLPTSTYRRQTFILTRVGTPAVDRYQIRPAIANPAPDNSGAINCLDVVGSGGGGSAVVQYKCDASFVGQSNHVWQFEVAPEWTGGSGDGDRPNPGASDTRSGAFIENTEPFCSGGAINGYSGNPDFVMSAAHCFVLLTDTAGNVTSPFSYRRRYDTRMSPPCQGTHYVDRVYYALGTTSLPQDTAFLRTGGSYSCASGGAWVGQRVNAGGQFTFNHGNLTSGNWMYSTGYPGAFTSSGKVPFACANPVRDQFSYYGFELDCQGGGGMSGSVWARWNSSDAYATGNNVIVNRSQAWCDPAVGCTSVTIPITQRHYWHTFDTKTRWESVT